MLCCVVLCCLLAVIKSLGKCNELIITEGLKQPARLSNAEQAITVFTESLHNAWKSCNPRGEGDYLEINRKQYFASASKDETLLRFEVCLCADISIVKLDITYTISPPPPGCD